ncbi:MAG TPA: sugar phosphate nucleotidyltransferase [Anaerolineales bacterium]|nr:sugar phosphate nucleotidyltransferase [Anaerolineales bacterium]
MRAVILAGGKGTRLLPYTTVLPKPLLPIGEMPILEIVLRQLKRAGVENAILTVGYLGSLLQAYFQDGAGIGLQLDYSFEDHPLGTAGPLALVRDRLTETFLITNGDILTTLDLRAMIRSHRLSGAAATVAMHARQVKIDLGVLEFDGSFILKGYKEKPTYDFHVSMGINVLEPRVLDYLDGDAYCDLPDLILRLIEAGEKVVGFPHDGYWQDLGRPDDYQQAVQDFEAMRAELLPEDE